MSSINIHVVNKIDGKTIKSIDWRADWISANKLHVTSQTGIKLKPVKSRLQISHQIEIAWNLDSAFDVYKELDSRCIAMNCCTTNTEKPQKFKLRFVEILAYMK